MGETPRGSRTLAETTMQQRRSRQNVISNVNRHNTLRCSMEKKIHIQSEDKDIQNT